MTNQFSVLPASSGYTLIEIDENYGDGNIDRWLSEPQPVLGFVIEKREHYFFVLPITAQGVYDDGECGQHALIRPDGKIDFCHCGNYIFESVDRLKVYLLRFAAQLNREMASGGDVDRKDAADWRRQAKKLEDEADNIGDWDWK